MSSNERSLWFIVEALCVLVLILLAIVVVDHIQIQHIVTQNQRLVQQVNRGLISQTQNRAANVNTWCGFDVAMKTSLQHYVQLFGPHVPKLHLPALNCAHIISKTLQSTRP